MIQRKHFKREFSSISLWKQISKSAKKINKINKNKLNIKNMFFTEAFKRSFIQDRRKNKIKTNYAKF